jgi:hypothetical protein
MAATNTLLRTVNLASAFCQLRPLLNIGGFTNEPGFSIGDWVRQFILAPPFAWRWNRSTVTTILVQGQQDYQLTLPNFGWIEKASILDTTAIPNVTKELNVVLNLSESSAQELPVQVAARLDDDNGNITFRFMPVPYQSYFATITYQNAAPTFQTINDTWSPIPDYYSYLVNQGFIAKSYEFIDNEKWGSAMQLFVKQVIAANSGLSDTQMNIFLNERINTAREQESQLQSSQQGRQGRGAQ